MPSSPLTGDAWVHRVLATVRPTSALDIGVGCGRFGFIFREKCEPRDSAYFFHPQSWRCRLDGIEGFEAYIGDVQKLLYTKVHIGNAMQVLGTLPDQYDLIHL